MKLRLLTVAMLVLTTVASAANAPAGEEKSARKKKPNPAFAPIEDVPGLPRVLLIGDSISVGYTLPTRELLKGKANVHRALQNCGPTTRGVERIDTWLGDGNWDVIHFNFGLHDIVYEHAHEQRVPPEQYEKNLREITEKIKATGAKCIWASTTPVPKEKVSPRRADKEVVAYNAIAKKVMKEFGIPIDDLYSYALPQLAEIQRPANVHFTGEGSKVLAKQVAKEILKALEEEDGK